MNNSKTQNQKSDEWTVVNTKKKTRRVQNKKNITTDEEQLNNSGDLFDSPTNNTSEEFPTTTVKYVKEDIGKTYNLPFKYNFWYHDIHNKDWSIKGYTKLCSIENVSDFWKLFNNISKIGYRINNFFLMKSDTDPTWEHVNNRNGGICSFKLDIADVIDVFEDICARMMCNKLNNSLEDINGISISPKNNWAILKIWNKNKHNDLTQTLDDEILEKYKDLSIKYKGMEPEY